MSTFKEYLQEASAKIDYEAVMTAIKNVCTEENWPKRAPLLKLYKQYDKEILNKVVKKMTDANSFDEYYESGGQEVEHY